MIGSLLAILLLILNFGISIWNAYSSGYNITLLRKANAHGFTKAAAYSGLGLAFVGMTYVLVIVLAFIAYSAGYVSADTVNYALGFDFLVFGLMIIGFGIMVTIQSIMIAIHRKSIWSILGAVWNVFAIAFDIYTYATSFEEATQLMQGNREGRGNALVLVIIALLIAFFIVRTAYGLGAKKAEGISTVTPQPKYPSAN
ncbi:MAG: hypothetical protein KGH59_00450 [Candidatus Micrarchaeota archaeon]|nr:hypothetical protein [Candidatus Micrarchaeota archaeon]MDE1804243.1 hypothetical protein [Candidatus Micrarchaeota archaeon]MDE1846985.1 hypothetical protein [Candidatus Micrarchaeota archaeon]